MSRTSLLFDVASPSASEQRFTTRNTALGQGLLLLLWVYAMVNDPDGDSLSGCDCWDKLQATCVSIH